MGKLFIVISTFLLLVVIGVRNAKNNKRIFTVLNKIMKEITTFVSKFDNVNNDIKLILEKSFPYMSDDFYTYNLINYLKGQKDKIEGENTELLNIIKSFLCISTPIYPENEIQEFIDYINKYDKLFL